MNYSESIDISGRWNDTDSRVTAEHLVKSILNSRWLELFQKTNNKRPILVIGDIKNKSVEHIESDTFIKDIEGEIIKEGTIRIIANSTFREKIRNERASQNGYVTEESRKKFGKEIGADFMIVGIINTIVDADQNDKLVYYQISLEMLDLETGEKVWTDSHKIKKYKSTTGKVRNHQKSTL